MGDGERDRRVTPGELTAARVTSAVVALLWAVLFYGVVDLAVVPLQDERFYDDYLLETGWGLLFTILVALPLLLWSLHPACRTLMQQVVAVSAAIALTGALALAPLQVGAAAMVTLSAWVPAELAGQRLWSAQGLSIARSSHWLVILAVVAAAAAVLYAVATIRAAHAGVRDDVSAGIRHLPMQAGFGLALAGSALVAALASRSPVPGWKVAAIPPALSAMWIGVVSLKYPEHLASLGRPGGASAIAWGSSSRLRRYSPDAATPREPRPHFRPNRVAAEPARPCRAGLRHGQTGDGRQAVVCPTLPQPLPTLVGYGRASSPVGSAGNAARLPRGGPTMGWFWGTILGVVVAFTLVGIVLDRRRGPSGPNAQSLDFNQDNRSG